MTRLSKLLTWCSENNIWIDPRIEVVDHADTGISVYSKDTHIDSLVTLVTIPKTTVLSVRSCTIAEMIPNAPVGHGAHLALSLAVYFEMLKGLESRWFGYLQSLPREPVGIALLWGSDVPQEHENLLRRDSELAQIWARGTEIERELRGEDGELLLEDNRRYYHSVVEPLMSKLSVTCSMDGFVHAYTLVSSRAFLVDAYHGLAMVPIADAFNHEQDHHVHLESDYDVCVDCGSLSQCAHDEDEGNRTDPGDQHYGNDNIDTCDMVSNRPVEAFCQIYNTYGESLTNAQLLSRYGFALDVNDNDVVCFEISDLLLELPQHQQEETPQNVDRNFFLWLFDQVIRIWPRFTGWRDSNLVYQPGTTFLTNALEPGKFEGRVRHPYSPVLCVNSDAKISHHLWVYCTLVTTVNEMGYMMDVDDTLRFLDRVAMRQIFREKNAGGSEEEEGSDAVQEYTSDSEERAERQPSRVFTDASEDPVIEQVISQVGRTVAAVCGRRGAKLGIDSQMSSVEMGEEVDRLVAGMKKTRMAVMEVMSEKSILESCTSVWEEFCTALDV